MDSFSLRNAHNDPLILLIYQQENRLLESSVVNQWRPAVICCRILLFCTYK